MSAQYITKLSRVKIGEQPFFVNFNNSWKHPREESFFDMIYISCFPKLTWKSMTFLVFLANIGAFIACFYYADMQRSGELFTPPMKSLFDFGMKDAYNIRYKWEVERFFASLLLFANFNHILLSSLALLIFGSHVEALLGFKKTFVFYFITGYAGNLLSALMSDKPSVQGSNASAAFLGVLLAYLIVKWEKWDYPGSGRTQMLVILLVGLTAVFATSYTYQIVDGLAMTGSFIIGVLFLFGVHQEHDQTAAMLTNTPRNPQHKYVESYQSRLNRIADDNTKCSRYLAILLIIIYLSAGTCAFFFVRQPQKV